MVRRRNFRNTESTQYRAVRRRDRHYRNPKKDHRRLRLSPVAPRGLQKDRYRTLEQVCSRTRSELAGRFHLFQARRERHRPTAREANDGTAALNFRPEGEVAVGEWRKSFRRWS